MAEAGFTDEQREKATQARLKARQQEQRLLDTLTAAGGDVKKALRPYLPEAVAQILRQMRSKDPRVARPALQMYVRLMEEVVKEEDTKGVIYLTAARRRSEFSVDGEASEVCPLCSGPCPLCGAQRQ